MKTYEGEMPADSMAAWVAWVAMSVAVRALSVPPKVPKGVRFADTINVEAAREATREAMIISWER